MNLLSYRTFRWGTQYLFILLSIHIFSTALVVAETNANTLRNYKQDQKLKTFQLPSLAAGDIYTYKTVSDKPSVLLFFSIRPEFRKKRSLALLSEFSDLATRYNNQAEFVAIYSDDEQTGTILDYMETANIRVPVLDDRDRQVYNDYGVFMMPLAILVKADGSLHEVVPYTFNIREIVEGNLKVLLGKWTKEDFLKAMQPEKNRVVSKEEKEYIRRVNYGKVMISRRMYSQAVRELKIAIKLLPQATEAYIELGFTQIAQRKWHDAEFSFRKALKHAPHSDDGIAGLGLSLYGQGDVEAALRELENALIAPKPRLEVIIALAEIHEKRENYTRANRLNKLAVDRLMKLYEHKWQ